MSRVFFTSPPSGQDTRSGESSSSYTADAWEAFKKTVEPLKPSQRHGRPKHPGRAQSWNKETGGTGGTRWDRNKKAQSSGTASGMASGSLNADTVRRAIRSGKFRPHATLDLHGMTCEQARVELNAFFERARIKQWQKCLIITGKGEGVLSRFFSETWLQTTPSETAFGWQTQLTPDKAAQERGAFF